MAEDDDRSQGPEWLVARAREEGERLRARRAHHDQAEKAADGQRVEPRLESVVDVRLGELQTEHGQRAPDADRQDGRDEEAHQRARAAGHEEREARGPEQVELLLHRERPERIEARLRMVVEDVEVVRREREGGERVRVVHGKTQREFARIVKTIAP